MPFSNVRASLTVPLQYKEETREEIDSAIDRLAARGIPIRDSAIDDECVDAPDDLE